MLLDWRFLTDGMVSVDLVAMLKLACTSVEYGAKVQQPTTLDTYLTYDY